MPGFKAPNRPGASYISDWFLHRAGVNAADNPATPATVTAVLDLSKNENGLTNQIWVGVVRTTGTGTIDITLFRKENGSWAAVVPHKQEATQATIATSTVTKFTGLMAGEYRVICTNLTAGAAWNIHVAHT